MQRYEEDDIYILMRQPTVELGTIIYSFFFTASSYKTDVTFCRLDDALDL